MLETLSKLEQISAVLSVELSSNTIISEQKSVIDFIDCSMNLD